MKLDKKLIAKKLDERGAYLPCARCNKQNFSIAEGFGRLDIQEEIGNGNIVMGGPHIPVAFVICNNCGSITSHALGALDMLKPESLSPSQSTPVPTPKCQEVENG